MMYFKMCSRLNANNVKSPPLSLFRLHLSLLKLSDLVQVLYTDDKSNLPEKLNCLIWQTVIIVSDLSLSPGVLKAIGNN